MTRYAAKVDANQVEIVAAFRKLGCSVRHLHRMGAGCPDLAAGFGGLTMLCEVKTEKGRLTQAQKDWARDWTGGIYLIRNIEDVQNCVNTMRLCVRLIQDGMRPQPGHKDEAGYPYPVDHYTRGYMT